MLEKLPHLKSLSLLFGFSDDIVRQVNAHPSLVSVKVIALWSDYPVLYPHFSLANPPPGTAFPAGSLRKFSAASGSGDSDPWL